ncbi:MAG: hypothetical protein WDW38_006085 [Sanguina aurantia]
MAAGTGQGRMWEDMRMEARRLESEVDVKLATYAKLCAGFEANFKLRTETSAGADQVRISQQGRMGWSTFRKRLAQGKAAELEELLQRLADLNDEMGGVLVGGNDSRAHTMARHKDVLLEFTQEFRKVNSTLGATRDRVQLLAGAGDSSLHGIQVQGQSSTGALLRERGTIASSTSAVDEILAQAHTVSSNLLDQRRIFGNITDRLLTLGSRFPVVNGLLNAIRRKKSKDTLVLTAVIAGCVLFTLVYLFAR